MKKYLQYCKVVAVQGLLKQRTELNPYIRQVKPYFGKSHIFSSYIYHLFVGMLKHNSETVNVDSLTETAFAMNPLIQIDSNITECTYL